MSGYPTSALLERFALHQLDSWPEAKQSYRALDDVKVRKMTVDNREYSVVFNPGRAISTGADVSAHTIKKRPCFLCEGNRPSAQTAIQLPEEFELLLNPYPILRPHYTVASKIHEAQRMTRQVLIAMLGLSDSAAEYVWFYNGPLSGASAPDHLHFQGGRYEDMINLGEFVNHLQPRILRKYMSAKLTIYPASSLPLFSIEGTDGEDVANLTLFAISCMGKESNDSEPRMNLYTQKLNCGTFRVIVMMRNKHRPACYGTGKGQTLFSPGAVDMGGGIILPREADFNKLTEQQLQDMLAEVTIDNLAFNRFVLNTISHEL